MKHLVFSYGSLILSENLERFKSKILKSVFLYDFYITVEKSPITKTNYHYIQLNQYEDTRPNDESIIPGFLIETEDIESIDKWEGNSYQRIEIICYDRYMEGVKCFVYIKK